MAFDDHSSESALRTDIVKKRNRAGGIVLSVNESGPCDGTTLGGTRDDEEEEEEEKEEACLSESPRALTMEASDEFRKGQK